MLTPLSMSWSLLLLQGDFAPGSDRWTAELRAEAARVGGAGGNAEGGHGEFWMSWV